MSAPPNAPPRPVVPRLLPPSPLPPPRRRRTWDWARAGQTVLVATAVAGAFTALGAVLAPGRWTGAVIGTVALVATALAGVRLLLPRPGVAPTVAVLFGAWLVFAVFADPDTFHLVPTGGTLDRLSETLHAGAHEIWVGKPPLTAGPGIVLFLAGGAVALLVFADLCVSVEVPVVSGFALLTPWLPGMVLGEPASVWSLVLTAVPWLALLADVGRLTWWRRGTAAAVSSAVVVVALALAPLFSHLPGWGQATRLLPFSGTISLSDDLDLRHDLTAQSDHVALRYTVYGASAAEVGPLREFTTTSFDGSSWAAPHAEDLRLPSDPLLGTPAQGTTLTSAVVKVQIDSLSDRYLPITASARTLDLDRTWGYEESRDAVWLSERTARGMSYTMETEVPAWTADQLRASRTSAGPADALVVPDTPHSAEIADLAAQVTAGKTTAYDRAAALQTWLRSDGGFVYDTSAPAGSDDVVWQFLDDKHGYCVHYATTMVVMARTLGIPARLAVGFLPGRTGGDGTTEVTGRNAHAWPELWFDDAGWVRFEPTPSRQSGPAPAWAPDPTASNPGSTSSPGPSTTTTPATGPTTSAPRTPPPTSAPTVTTPAPTGSDATVADQGSGLGWLVWLLVGVGAVAAGVLVVVVRRRSRVAPSDPERAWVRVRQAFVRAGMGWPESTTPRQVLTLPLTGLVPGDEGDDAVRHALTALATTLETTRYARPDPTSETGPATGPQVAAWVTTIETGLRRHRSGRVA